ncbi:flavin reductase [Urechidicola sp. KH5]
MIITQKDIDQFGKIYRINLMNSLSGFKSSNLIGTKSKQGIENVAVFSSVVHLGSNPPLLGFILRPATVPRNTYENLKSTGCYTINHITKSMTKQAHHTSAKYHKEISEFEVTNLTPKYINGFYAPFVLQSPVQIAMKYLEEYPIRANGTILIVGQIEFFKVVPKMLKSDGFLDLPSQQITAINGLDAYTVPQMHERYEYQRPIKLTT